MIRITDNSASFRSEFQRKLAVAKNPRGMLMASGRELGNQLKKHFRAKDKSSANRLSDRRSHFWLAVSRTVQNPVQSGYNQVSVTVSDPRIAQKVFGGKITAKDAGALTIPVEERAYGRTAATFEQETGLKLFLIKSGKGDFERALLATKSANGGFTVEYLLTPSVDQDADPTALPDENLLRQAILARAESVLQHEVKQA